MVLTVYTNHKDRADFVQQTPLKQTIKSYTSKVWNYTSMLTELNSSLQIRNRESKLYSTLRKCNPVHILTTSQRMIRFSITLLPVNSSKLSSSKMFFQRNSFPVDPPQTYSADLNLDFTIITTSEVMWKSLTFKHYILTSILHLISHRSKYVIRHFTLNIFILSRPASLGVRYPVS